MSNTINFAADGTVVTTAWLRDINTIAYTSVKNALLYGVTGDGVTDDTAAINTLLALGGFIYFPVPVSFYKIAGVLALTPVSNSVIFGAGKQSLFKAASGDQVQFYLNGLSNVIIRDVGIQATASGGTSVAGIRLDNCTDCIIEHNDFNGLSGHGVWLRGACLRNTVRANYFHNGQGTVQDSADVCIYSVAGSAAPAFNSITGNFLYSGTEHGVLIQDPYTLPSVLPQRNTVEGNFIGQHTGYGVTVYMPNEAAAFTGVLGPASNVLTVSLTTGGTLAIGQDVFTLTGVIIGRIVSLGSGIGGNGTYNMSVSGSVTSRLMVSASQANSHNKIAFNHIDDIQGSYATNRDSGAGVYVVGAGAGGTIVTGNTIRNCCVQTLTEGLTPGGIGINGISNGCAPVVVSGNTITDMPQFHGIVVAGVGLTSGNVVATGNTVIMPSANTSGISFKVNAASNVSAVGNYFTNLNLGVTSDTVAVFANASNIGNINITGNQILGGGREQIVVNQSGAFTVSDLTIANNTLSGVGVSGNGAISLENGVVASALISGNVVESITVPAIRMVAALNVRFVGNIFNSTGTNSIIASGTCTGSYLDKTNLFNALMVDTSTGFYKETIVAAIPSTGTWALPARAQNTVGTSATPSAWRLTVAGSPGTWTNEGNNP